MWLRLRAAGNFAYVTLVQGRTAHMTSNVTHITKAA
jgi:hypothetical protein